MSKLRQATGILTSILVLSAGVVALTTRAADQGTQPPKQPVPAAKSPAPGAPQVPEESATIRDDPTIAPDPKQSADNNVSFPNDI